MGSAMAQAKVSSHHHAMRLTPEQFTYSLGGISTAEKIVLRKIFGDVKLNSGKHNIHSLLI
jgi:hypothetical protein